MVYLDDIAVFGDDRQQVLDDTLEAVRRLTRAGFMINLSKSQLVERSAKILGHTWYSGGYWAPVVTKLEALLTKTEEELARMNRASLYGLLNFYREYLPAFAETTEPLRELLGQDAQPWTTQATEAVRRTITAITNTPRWLNADLAQEIRMESRVTSAGIAVVLLQRHPEHRRRWLPVATWGRAVDALERNDSRVLLELRALREGAHKLVEFTAFARHLTMLVSPELRALLKLSTRAHPELQALLIDLLHYRPTFLVHPTRKAPESLGMETPETLPPELLEDLTTAEKALQTPIHLPPKARFQAGPAVHV